MPKKTTNKCRIISYDEVCEMRARFSFFVSSKFVYTAVANNRISCNELKNSANNPLTKDYERQMIIGLIEALSKDDNVACCYIPPNNPIQLAFGFASLSTDTTNEDNATIGKAEAEAEAEAEADGRSTKPKLYNLRRVNIDTKPSLKLVPIAVAASLIALVSFSLPFSLPVMIGIAVGCVLLGALIAAYERHSIPSMDAIRDKMMKNEKMVYSPESSPIRGLIRSY